mgnify:FL=1
MRTSRHQIHPESSLTEVQKVLPLMHPKTESLHLNLKADLGFFDYFAQH